MSFRMFGFPITINLSFLGVLAMLGYVSFQNRIDLIVAFVAIGVVSVLIHEFGHAFAAKSQGTQEGPIISLEGMAGFTRYRLQSPPSRGQSIFISFAGPLAGIILGLISFGVSQSGIVEATSFNQTLFRISYFTTFVWSAFNLLPIVPLDGGHIMTEVLPGSSLVRRRRAAMVSIGVAIVVGGLLYLQWRLLFAPIILGGMAYQNFQILQRSRQAV